MADLYVQHHTNIKTCNPSTQVQEYQETDLSSQGINISWKWMQKEIKQGVKGRNLIERRDLESFLGLVWNDVKKAKSRLEIGHGESIKDNKSFCCSISSKNRMNKQNVACY